MIAPALLPQAILACSVCFGDPASPLTQGAKAGVLLMLGVIGFVLAAIAGIAIFWARRARMLEASEAYERKPVMTGLVPRT